MADMTVHKDVFCCLLQLCIPKDIERKVSSITFFCVFFFDKTGMQERRDILWAMISIDGLLNNKGLTLLFCYSLDAVDRYFYKRLHERKIGEELRGERTGLSIVEK